jgi:ActR/RegA family two-component response regulator
MPGLSLSASRPAARALIVGNESCRALAGRVLERLGYVVSYAVDPYSACAEACRQPLAYRAVVLGLNALYREELALILTLRRRLGHVEIYLAQTDGRAAALAEAARMGATGLLSEEGLHPFNQDHAAEASSPAPPPEPAEPSPGEPILSPDELRALLEETAGQ